MWFFWEPRKGTIPNKISNPEKKTGNIRAGGIDFILNFYQVPALCQDILDTEDRVSQPEALASGSSLGV
jgi:hypothetical protein